MGGRGSGLPYGRPVVEACRCLDIRLLMRRRWLVPGRYTSGVVSWNSSSSIRFEGCLDESDPFVRLLYSVRGEDRDYRIGLQTTPVPCGRRRWWWICPLSNTRCAQLYLPPGATVFGCRTHYRLGYQYERGTPIDRLYD